MGRKPLLQPQDWPRIVRATRTISINFGQAPVQRQISAPAVKSAGEAAAGRKDAPCAHQKQQGREIECLNPINPQAANGVRLCEKENALQP